MLCPNTSTTQMQTTVDRDTTYTYKAHLPFKINVETFVIAAVVQFISLLYHQLDGHCKQKQTGLFLTKIQHFDTSPLNDLLFDFRQEMREQTAVRSPVSFASTVPKFNAATVENPAKLETKTSGNGPMGIFLKRAKGCNEIRAKN